MKWALALLLVAQIVSTWGGKRYWGKMMDLKMRQLIDPNYGQMMGSGDVQIIGPGDERRIDPDDELIMDLEDELEKLTEDFICLKEDIENCKKEKTMLSDRISQLLTKLAHKYPKLVCQLFPGLSWTAADGCNKCACRSGGFPICTLMYCGPIPIPEPWPRPAPEPKPAPRRRPAPIPRPAPGPKPGPEPKPAQGSKPAPRPKPAQGPKPAPSPVHRPRPTPGKRPVENKDDTHEEHEDEPAINYYEEKEEDDHINEETDIFEYHEPGANAEEEWELSDNSWKGEEDHGDEPDEHEESMEEYGVTDEDTWDDEDDDEHDEAMEEDWDKDEETWDDEEEDVCSQPKKVGPCKAAKRRWFYHSKSGKCKKFIYGGCQGNDNNFETKQDCKDMCSTEGQEGSAEEEEEEEQEEEEGKEEDVCLQPKYVGPCKAAKKRWFFNKNTGNCEKFTYGGCHGNGNNFNTKKKCENICGQEGCPLFKLDTSILCIQPDECNRKTCLADDKKCCLTHCGRDCKKPGCYDKTGNFHAVGEKFDDDCNSCTCNKKFKIRCTKKRCPKVCPPLKTGQIGICVEQCSKSKICPDGKLCCSNGCGHTCVSGVPASSDGLNVVKP